MTSQGRSVPDMVLHSHGKEALTAHGLHPMSKTLADICLVPCQA